MKKEFTMLELLVRMFASRWTKFMFLGLWVTSLLWMLERGWVWESWEVVPGGMEHRLNYFEIQRTPLFVWLSLILLGYLAHMLKIRSLGYYGLVEVIVGAVGGFIGVAALPLTSVAAWVVLAGSVYTIVEGASNISESVKSSK